MGWSYPYTVKTVGSYSTAEPFQLFTYHFHFSQVAGPRSQVQFLQAMSHEFDPWGSNAKVQYLLAY